MGMILFIFLVTVLPCVAQARSTEFFCYICDDGTDNTDCQTTTRCYNSQEVQTGNISQQIEVMCMTRIYFHENGLILQKTCANPQMCEAHEGKNKERCESPDEEFEGICSYCCDTAGCNKGLPPYVNQEKRTHRYFK